MKLLLDQMYLGMFVRILAMAWEKELTEVIPQFIPQ